MRRAFTRAVSPRIAECALTHLERVPIDAARAAAQHAAYERALAAASFEIVRLLELPDDPDAVFVEDTALALGGHAIITRPGVASRADETESTAQGLEGKLEVHRLRSGYLDGGDVLRIDRRLYVGLSTRTDGEGIAALRQIAGPLGYEVIAEPGAANCLRAGDRLIMAAGSPKTAERLRARGFEVVELDVSELQKAEAGVTCMSLIDER